jgi:hypothetical protein
VSTLLSTASVGGVGSVRVIFAPVTFPETEVDVMPHGFEALGAPLFRVSISAVTV